MEKSPQETFQNPKCSAVRHASIVNYNDAIHLQQSSEIAGLYCTVGYAHIVSPRLRGVNRLSFCLLSWGRWSVFILAGGGESSF
jgi:hypothetical protein